MSKRETLRAAPVVCRIEHSSAGAVADRSAALPLLSPAGHAAACIGLKHWVLTRAAFCAQGDKASLEAGQHNRPGAPNARPIRAGPAGARRTRIVSRSFSLGPTLGTRATSEQQVCTERIHPLATDLANKPLALGCTATSAGRSLSLARSAAKRSGSKKRPPSAGAAAAC